MEKGFFLYSNDDNQYIDFLKEIQLIFSKIDDDISKTIYINRLLYSAFLDSKYLREVIKTTNIGRKFDNFLDILGEECSILIYGAGKCAKQLVEIFPEKNWKGFIDIHKSGKLLGMEINNINEYTDLSDYKIIVSNQVGYQEIARELQIRGVAKDNIFCLEDWNKQAAKNQYFEKRCINMENISSFVDAGTFDGYDSLKLLDRVNGNVRKIWAFEPDKIQFDKCKKIFEPYKNVELFHLGLGERTYKSNIVLMNNSGSYIGKAPEGVEVSVVSLDDMHFDEKIDFIKMDIEGFEEKALIGAKNIIKRDKPKLAISIYHKRDDVFKIPSVILKLNENYKFALGHYSIRNVDTVLYAF